MEQAHALQLYPVHIVLTFYTGNDWIFVPECSLYQFTRLEAFSSLYITFHNLCASGVRSRLPALTRKFSFAFHESWNIHLVVPCDHRHWCNVRVLVQFKQLTWQHQWKVQWQRSVTLSVRVLYPRPQHSSSHPSRPGDELLHVLPDVPKVPILPLYEQKFGDFSK